MALVVFTVTRGMQGWDISGLPPLLKGTRGGGVHYRVLASTLRSRASSMRLRSWSVRPVATLGRRPWADG